MRRQTACVALAIAPDHSAWSGAVTLPIALEIPDARADGQVRHVDMLDYDIVIERQVAGVKMRLSVPYPLFEGVALCIRPASFGETMRVRVSLVHEDRDLDVPLYQAGDDRDVTAAWQYWANRLGLPLLIDNADGTLSEPFPRLGALLIGRPRPRRVPSHFAKRRPRFLVRRRVGRPGIEPIVHSGREIIARD